MLENKNPYVKKWAAFLAFEIDPLRAERVLEEISRNYLRDLNLGFSAGFTLELWRKGELRTISSWECKKVIELGRRVPTEPNGRGKDDRR